MQVSKVTVLTDNDKKLGHDLIEVAPRKGNHKQNKSSNGDMSVGIPGNSFFFDTNVSNVEKKQTKKEESKKATPEKK